MRLYKYACADRIDILESGVIRFTQPGALNDCFEMWPVYYYPSHTDILDRFVRDFEGSVKKAYESIGSEEKDRLSFNEFRRLAEPDFRAALQQLQTQRVRKVQDDTRKALELQDKDTAILCLSSDPYNLLMWAHYADNHRGLVIEFDADHSFFDQRLVESDALRHLRRVTYSHERPRLSFEGLNLDTYRVYLAKSLEWAYEKEWRMILLPRDSDIRKPAHPYDIFLYHLPREAITSVILGCRMDQRKRDEVRKLVSNKEELRHIRLYQAKLSEDTYELCFEILDCGRPKFHRRSNTRTDFSALVEKGNRAYTPCDIICRPTDYYSIRDALQDDPVVVIIRGPLGIGKTTFVHGFLNWLNSSEVPQYKCAWFDFHDVRSAESVINCLGENYFDTSFAEAGLVDRIDALADQLRHEKLLIVWDNFEFVQGIAELGIDAFLTEEDQGYLSTFVNRLSGGKCKVLITSLTDEAWLGGDRFQFDLSDFRFDEKRRFAALILKEHIAGIDLHDPALTELFGLLRGHPLFMHVVVPDLKVTSAQKVVDLLKSELSHEATQYGSLFSASCAAVGYALMRVPEGLKLLPLALALHGRFVGIPNLYKIVRQVDDSLAGEDIQGFLQSLLHRGLLASRGQEMYEIHPAFHQILRVSFLQNVEPSVRDSWARAFVRGMERLTSQYVNGGSEERDIALWHRSNLYSAIEEAMRLDMYDELITLISTLGNLAVKRREFDTAQRLFKKLADQSLAHDDCQNVSLAYGQFGAISRLKQDFLTAEKWYRESYKILRESGIEGVRAVGTYLELAAIARNRGDFSASEGWYRKCLAAYADTRSDLGLAYAYDRLGSIALAQEDHKAAEEWYRKSLEITERIGDARSTALKHAQVGCLLSLQKQFYEAGESLIKGIKVGAQLDDFSVSEMVSSFVSAFQEATPEDRARLRSLWRQSKIGEFPGVAVESPITQQSVDERNVTLLHGNPSHEIGLDGLTEVPQMSQCPRLERLFDKLDAETHTASFRELDDLLVSLVDEQGEGVKLAARLAVFGEIISEDMWSAFGSMILEGLSGRCIRRLQERGVLVATTPYPSFGHPGRYAAIRAWWLDRNRKGFSYAQEAASHLILQLACRIRSSVPEVREYARALIRLMGVTRDLEVEPKLADCCLYVFALFDSPFVFHSLRLDEGSFVATVQEYRDTAPLIVWVLARCVEESGEAGDLHLRDRLLQELQEIHRLLPGDHVVREKLASALLNTRIAAKRENNLSLRNSVVGELRCLHERFRDDEDVRERFARALYQTQKDLEEEGCPERQAEIIQELERLLESFPHDQDIADYLTLALIPDPEDSTQVEQQLQYLSKRFPDIFGDT